MPRIRLPKKANSFSSLKPQTKINMPETIDFVVESLLLRAALSHQEARPSLFVNADTIDFIVREAALRTSLSAVISNEMADIIEGALAKLQERGVKGTLNQHDDVTTRHTSYTMNLTWKSR